jgi:ribosomal protein S18 acetylase RimI-like enzyme
MLASVANRQGELSGLRAFNPLRDIGPMVELIELSFAGDLDPQSRQMLKEMRTLSHLGGPLLWLLSRTSPTLRNFFSGYVWVEEGRIVGNITVHQRWGHRGWFISNLAVHPDYRRRGIAHSLMVEGMGLARKRGASRVSLEVRARNLAAQELYEKLGFTKVGSVSKMRLEMVGEVSTVPLMGYEIRMVKPNEWRKRYQLAEDTFSLEAKKITPVQEEEYRLNFAQRLGASIGDLLKGQTVRHWAAQRDDRFWALLTLRTGGAFAPHSLAMMVHPDHRGKVEEILLTKALSTVRAYPSRPLSAEIQPSYEGAVEIFERHGFVEEETLNLLTLRL